MAYHIVDMPSVLAMSFVQYRYGYRLGGWRSVCTLSDECVQTVCAHCLMSACRQSLSVCTQSDECVQTVSCALSLLLKTVACAPSLCPHAISAKHERFYGPSGWECSGCACLRSMT